MSRFGTLVLVLAVIPWLARSRASLPVFTDEATLRSIEMACGDGLRERLPGASPAAGRRRLQVEPLGEGRYLVRSLLQQGRHQPNPFLCEVVRDGTGFRAVAITLIEW